jgi:hypothetical protein
MSRMSHRQSRVSNSFNRLFAANSLLLIGMAFDVGIMLGHRTGATLLGRKIHTRVSNLADRVVALAPDSVSNLVPDLLPPKSRASRRKPSGKRRAAG